MKPKKKSVDGVASVVNEHVDGAMILGLLMGVAKMYPLTELVHRFKEWGGGSRASGRAATGTLSWTNNRRGVGVLIGGGGDAMGSLDAVDDVTEGLLPHSERARRSTHNGKAQQPKAMTTRSKHAVASLSN